MSKSAASPPQGGVTPSAGKRHIAIRQAKQEDAALIAALLQDLAVYMKMMDGFKVSAETVANDAFGETPRITFVLAVSADSEGESVLGLVGFFETYSSFKAKPCLFIDSLYVTDEARGTGAGRALMAYAAQEAIQRGCIRLDLNVLDWNPARGAYGALGMEYAGEVAYTISGEALLGLAAK